MGWWVEQGDLILIDNDAFDTIVGVIDGKQPSAASHPLRAALTQPKDSFEPAAYGFVDLAALPPVPENPRKAGLDGVKRIELQWGFQDEALMTLVRVIAPSPRRGVLAFFDQPTFDLRSLPPLPAGHPAFAVLSVDLARTYDQFAALVKSTNPGGEQSVEAFENAVRGQFGLDPRNDLLKHLGPKLALYSQATAPPPPGGNPMAAVMAAYTGLTLTFQVRDEAALSKQLEVLIKGINQVLGQRPQGGGADPPQFRKQDGPRTEYVLEFPPGSIPDGPLGMLSPTIALDKEQLIISGTSSAAEKALALVAGPADKRWSATDASVRVAERIPRNLMMLVITDPRETMPAVIDNLPAIAQSLNTQIAQGRGGAPGPAFNLRIDAGKLPKGNQLRPLLFPSSTSLTADAQGIQILQREAVPSLTSPATSGVLVGLLLPAVQSAREAARRAQCVNNIKQIMLAMHNYHSANNSFPRDVTGKDGKPLLSWRVAILPYIEQAELYNKFKLDEPWDSPHNKELLKEMPPTFKCPSRAKPEPFTTTYRGFVGAGAMFETGQDIGIVNVTDGTSNTIAVAEASAAVPWSKPADLPFDQQAQPSLYGAGSSHPGGFNCGFADGSVRFIKNSISAVVFKALITRNGGEVINADAF
jgi:prepilin-type processing-associated H-X9-DG protein